MRIKIINGRIITPYRLIEGGTLAFEGERIVHVGQSDCELEDCTVVNARGNYVSPGFVDIHTHGGGGHDFMDGSSAAILGAARLHAEHGTTSIVPTTLTSSDDDLYRTFAAFREAKASNSGAANLMGLHLEGPYFCRAQAGAQDPRYIRNPRREEYERILDQTDDIVRWSIAPELDGAMEMGRVLRDRGILPAIGHSDAEYEQVLEALDNGYTHITHLYSAMSGVHRRNAYRYLGVIESALLIDELSVEIIADGCHLPPALIQLILKIKGPAATALISDSLRGAGMPAGESISGSLGNGQRVIIEDGVAKLPDRSAFAGSVATADRLVRTVVAQAKIPLLDTVRMMSTTPARIMGFARKGSLSPGMDADILIFDDDIQMQRVFVMGRSIYEKQDFR